MDGTVRFFMMKLLNSWSDEMPCCLLCFALRLLFSFFNERDVKVMKGIRNVAFAEESISEGRLPPEFRK